MTTTNKTQCNSFLSNPLTQKVQSAISVSSCHLSSLPFPAHHKPISIYSKLLVPERYHATDIKQMLFPLYLNCSSSVEKSSPSFKNQLKCYFLKSFTPFKIYVSLHSLQTSTIIKGYISYYLLLCVSPSTRGKSYSFKEKRSSYF